jgi:hypothetical protein
MGYFSLAMKRMKKLVKELSKERELQTEETAKNKGLLLGVCLG